MNMKKWIIFRDLNKKWTVSPPIHLDRDTYEKTDLTFKQAVAYWNDKASETDVLQR